MRKRYLLTMLAVAIGMLSLTIVSLSQDTHTVGWHTVDGGGGVSTGSTFTVRGAAGQPDAGVSNGVTYTVRGGFWGGVAAEHDICLPLVLCGY